jgi:hypothetical protein
MGFLLASTGLLVLWITIHAFWLVRNISATSHAGTSVGQPICEQPS